MKKHEKQMALHKAILSPGEWFRFPKRLLFVLSVRDSIVLAAIINRAVIHDAYAQKHNGWFKWSYSELRADVFLTKRQLQESIKCLKRQKFVEITKKGVPPKLQIKINMEALISLFNRKFDHTKICTPAWAQNCDHSWAQNCDHSWAQNCDQPIYKELIKNNKRISPASGGVCKLHPRWKVYADELVSEISKIQKINKLCNTSTWPRILSKLKDMGISPKRISEAIKWYGYARQNKVPYIPVIHSANSFVEKFLRLEDSKARYDEKNGIAPQEQIQLNSEQKRINRGLVKELSNATEDQKDNFGAVTVKLDEYVVRLHKLIGKLKEPEKKKSFAINTYVESRIFFHQYVLWINQQIASWDGWGGNWDAFLPGGKHFKRYLVKVTGGNVGLSKSILECLYEAQKN